MSVVVLGANGMAGHMISNYLEHVGYKVFRITREHINIEAFEEAYLDQLIGEAKYIINCIGVLGPDSNKDISRTVLVNSWFPKFLETNYPFTKIIHISTDCVFDGKRGYYIETDLPNETNIYGRSKALGEINNDKDITLRMSIIGTEIKEQNRSGLLNWVLTNPSEEIQGWEQSIWNGITTLELAKQIHNFIQRPKVSGIYHLVPDFVISKYELVDLINEIFECGKTVVPVPGKSENKTLIDTRTRVDIFTEIPNYVNQLLELRDFTRNT